MFKKESGARREEQNKNPQGGKATEGVSRMDIEIERLDQCDKEFEIKGHTLVKYRGEGGIVTILSGVTSIGEDTFYGCKALTSITIPASVTSIGERAFSGCEGLTNITIPPGVTSIGEFTFCGCEGLTSAMREAIRARFGEDVF